ncbi:Xaa-Pro peptidase family protein [Roseibium porphyridii]|uniref:Xaa-Pro peptidase family protein n=1 Tax=Roseibium porphyridii TaxID=2866279 RepID=A0ABY8F9L5_9HYPH|nr:Xaa-Pro peptidase family protein [Roseibium sp. KMA01]WFE91239.1 Xaa-Pro peptidase family protein [Roseibium sp. KMA01]
MTEVPSRGFPETEFEARTHRAQFRMAAAAIDGILFTSEPEIRYFSGFQTLFWQSPTRPWFLYLPSTGKPIAIIPEIGAQLMHSTWLDDIRTWSAPCPEDDGVSLLTELLTPLARERKTLGVMKGHETGLRMPLGDYERLLQGLPNLSIADATGLVRSLRMIKSEREIEKLAHICAIGSRTFAKIPELAHEGQPFEDLFRAFRREGLAQGADDVPYLVGGADQGGYHDVISPPSRRPLARGDVLMLDTGAVWDGYYCDFDRNFAVGTADEATQRAYDVLWRATEAGINAARAGVTCHQLYQVMRGVIAELDDRGGDVGRLGHGLGMQLTEWPSHAPFDHTPIAENMVLTLEPSLSYGDARIMVHEENIVIREDGAQLLSERASRDLPVI